MPLLEIEGLGISQTMALIRYLARHGDLYGDMQLTHLWCDKIAGVASDLVETAMQAAFQPNVDIAIKALWVGFAKFGPRLEMRLANNGEQFTGGKRFSIADIVLAEALTSYLEFVPDILKETPLLANLHEVSRGVNPRRRCLGAAVLGYGLTTLHYVE
jgi:glutathione S-transferase